MELLLKELSFLRENKTISKTRIIKHLQRIYSGQSWSYFGTLKSFNRGLEATSHKLKTQVVPKSKAELDI